MTHIFSKANVLWLVMVTATVFCAGSPVLALKHDPNAATCVTYFEAEAAFAKADADSARGMRVPDKNRSVAIVKAEADYSAAIRDAHELRKTGKVDRATYTDTLDRLKEQRGAAVAEAEKFHSTAVAKLKAARKEALDARAAVYQEAYLRDPYILRRYGVEDPDMDLVHFSDENSQNHVFYRHLRVCNEVYPGLVK